MVYQVTTVVVSIMFVLGLYSTGIVWAESPGDAGVPGGGVGGAGGESGEGPASPSGAGPGGPSGGSSGGGGASGGTGVGGAGGESPYTTGIWRYFDKPENEKAVFNDFNYLRVKHPST